MQKLALGIVISLIGMACNTDNEMPTPCSANEPATIRDLSGLDGCGFVFELSDGTRLEPVRFFYCGTPPLPDNVTVDPLNNFELQDGKQVYIAYEPYPDWASICMVGQMVKITCIVERQVAAQY